MKFSSILVASVLACLALAACNPPVEEKALTKESTGEKPRILPECAQRNQDSTYKNGHGCSKDEWVEWQKNR